VHKNKQSNRWARVRAFPSGRRAVRPQAPSEGRWLSIGVNQNFTKPGGEKQTCASDYHSCNDISGTMSAGPPGLCPLPWSHSIDTMFERIVWVELEPYDALLDLVSIVAL